MTPCRDGSNEGSRHMFCLEIRKIIFELSSIPPFIWSSVFETIISSAVSKKTSRYCHSLGVIDDGVVVVLRRRRPASCENFDIF